MVALTSVVILALQLLGTDTPADSFPDAYFDSAARSLVELARDRRTAVEGRIESYSTLARRRISVGVRALRRDRMLYRCEAASRVQWHRTDTIRVELIGGREVAPMFSSRVRAGDGDCGDSFFDPASDRLGIALGGSMSRDDSSYLRHPLAAGSEQDYRFRAGGTTALRLADGSTVRLHELQVLPRRSEPYLVSGSLWLEDRSHAVVRAILRLARPFDYDRDRSGHAAGAEDDDLPRILRPLRADIRYVTIEYGLWDQQWWLPRLVAFEGEAEIGALVGVPVKMEQSFAEYEVVALPSGQPVPEPPQMPADSICRDLDEDDDDRDDGDRDEARDGAVHSKAANGGVEYRRRRSCECTAGRCRVVVTEAVIDSDELIRSDLLPPSIFDGDGQLVTAREMEDLLERAQQIPTAPWQLAPITWRTGLQGFDLVRYNRVEGLSVGASASAELGGAAVEGIVRLGIADLEPNVQLAASRGSAVSSQRLGAYRRLRAVGPVPSSLGPGSSLSALLFGRDDGDYFRTWGVDFVREPAAGRDGLTWRLFAEMQRAAEKHTDFSLANAFGEADFRPNIEAQPAEQAGLDLQLRGSRGADPTGWRGAATAGLLGSVGSFNYVQPRLTLAAAAPLPGALLGALELNVGTTAGEAPLQSWYFLGGGRTVRGYDGNAAHGETFWTARGEIATSAPGARIVLFSDAGWAGQADVVSVDPLLLSVGAGVSFLDGLLRLDLARPIRKLPSGDAWRLELQIDAGL